MTQLSVADAALRVGVSRQTLFKKIKNGEISSTLDQRGTKQVDISELLRVFGSLQSSDSKPSDSTNRERLSTSGGLTAELQLELERSKMQLQLKEMELKIAQERIDELKIREAESKQRDRENIEERQRLLGVIETQNRLLAAPVPSKPAARPRTAAKAPAKSVVNAKVVKAVKKPVQARKTSAKPVAKEAAKKVVAKAPARPTRSTAPPPKRVQKKLLKSSFS